MVKAPNKFSKERQHRSFGIENWLRKQGIYDNTIQSHIMEHFLIDNSFEIPKGGKKIISNSKSAFIQNRFDKFCAFALRYKKENLI